MAYGFLVNENLPSEDAIIACCRKAGFEVSGTKLVDETFIGWVKYGPNVAISEALTQDWTAKALRHTPDCGLSVPRVFHAFTRNTPSFAIGYIVMEFVDAPDCDSKDAREVSRAVQALTDLPAPLDMTLGHIGGTSIAHSFFHDWVPVADYKSVQDLDEHINNVLRYMKVPKRVDLVADASSGLRLSVCDIHPGNFKKLPNGQLVALDFRATCFMPPSFVMVAMRKSRDAFGRAVAGYIKYPSSSVDVSALLSVSNYLVQFGQQAVAFPLGLKRRVLYGGALLCIRS